MSEHMYYVRQFLVNLTAAVNLGYSWWAFTLIKTTCPNQTLYNFVKAWMFSSVIALTMFIAEYFCYELCVDDQDYKSEFFISALAVLYGLTSVVCSLAVGLIIKGMSNEEKANCLVDGTSGYFQDSWFLCTIMSAVLLIWGIHRLLIADDTGEKAARAAVKKAGIARREAEIEAKKLAAVQAAKSESDAEIAAMKSAIELRSKQKILEEQRRRDENDAAKATTEEIRRSKERVRRIRQGDLTIEEAAEKLSADKERKLQAEAKTNIARIEQLGKEAVEIQDLDSIKELLELKNAEEKRIKGEKDGDDFSDFGDFGGRFGRRSERSSEEVAKERRQKIKEVENTIRSKSRERSVSKERDLRRPFSRASENLPRGSSSRLRESAPPRRSLSRYSMDLPRRRSLSRDSRDVPVRSDSADLSNVTEGTDVDIPERKYSD